jgi:predicted RNase H-like HicB family nuclease
MTASVTGEDVKRVVGYFTNYARGAETRAEYFRAKGYRGEVVDNIARAETWQQAAREVADFLGAAAVSPATAALQARIAELESRLADAIIGEDAELAKLILEKRFQLEKMPQEAGNMWYASCAYLTGAIAFGGHTPREALRAARAALDAKPAPDLEPERPEPKFRVGDQVVTKGGLLGTVREVDNEGGAWVYKPEWVDGEKRTTWWMETDLLPAPALPLPGTIGACVGELLALGFRAGIGQYVNARPMSAYRVSFGREFGELGAAPTLEIAQDAVRWARERKRAAS